MRPILACLAAVGVGAAGALILGEYSFGGVVVLASGSVLGLFVGEVAVAVRRRPDRRLGVACGFVSAAAMLWAGWISTAHDLSFVGPAGWASIALAAAAGFLRAGWSRPGSGNPAAAPAPSASPQDRPPAG